MKVFLGSFFMILMLRNIIETILPDGKVMIIAKGILRVFCFIWILSIIGALYADVNLTEMMNGLYGNQNTENTLTQESIWLAEEYEKILMDAADDIMAKEGMMIASMDIDMKNESDIQAVRVGLQSVLLSKSSVEIQIRDITIQDPAISRESSYRELLSAAWGIPEEAIYIHIIE